MKIRRADDETVVLDDIDGVVVELLQKLPESADPTGSEAAEARLFPRLTGGREPRAEEEWKEFVEPDLRELFRGVVETVAEDLKNLPAKNKTAPARLLISIRHLEAWIHVLNQARLALAARHEFTDEELESEIPLEGGSRSFVLFQIHFYGVLQEYFLRQLE